MFLLTLNSLFVRHSAKTHCQINSFVVSPSFGSGSPSVVSTTSARRSQPRADKTRSDVPASCATAITPSCLQSLYGIPATPATQASNVLGVSAFEGEYASHSDLSVSALFCELRRCVYLRTADLLVIPHEIPSRCKPIYDIQTGFGR